MTAILILPVLFVFFVLAGLPVVVLLMAGRKGR